MSTKVKTVTPANSKRQPWEPPASLCQSIRNLGADLAQGKALEISSKAASEALASEYASWRTAWDAHQDGKPSTRVELAQQIDPTCPKDREGYRANAVYRAIVRLEAAFHGKRQTQKRIDFRFAMAWLIGEANPKRSLAIEALVKGGATQKMAEDFLGKVPEILTAKTKTETKTVAA